jgi:hypothetical protein
VAKPPQAKNQFKAPPVVPKFNSLSFNKISEYHTEIELIPFDQLDNIYIKVPMSLEQRISINTSILR